MIRPFLLSLMLVGCSRVLEVSDRANCSGNSVATDMEGVLEWTQTNVYDAEGRQVSRVLDWVDIYLFTETWTYDDQGCLVENALEYQYPDGSVYSEIREAECDQNGDPVVQRYAQERTGDQPYTWEQETLWDREYGDNGLTATAEQEVDFGGFGSQVVDLTYTYDDKDRLVRLERDLNGGRTLETTSWFDELRTDDLPAAEEERDVTGLLVDATYYTYDDRGRETLQQRLRRGVEELTATVWDDDRYRSLRRQETRDGVLHRTDETVYDDEEEPWMARTVTSDRLNADGEEGADGVPDQILTSTWTCD